MKAKVIHILIAFYYLFIFNWKRLQLLKLTKFYNNLA